MSSTTNSKIIFDVKRADDGLKKAFLSEGCKINETILNKIIYSNGGGYSKEEFSEVLPVLIYDYEEFLRCESKMLAKHKHGWYDVYFSDDFYKDIQKIYRHAVRGQSRPGVVINNALYHAFKEMGHHNLDFNARNLFHWAKVRDLLRAERGGRNAGQK